MSTVQADLDKVKENLQTVQKEIKKGIVGHEQLIEELMVCLLTGGHALIEGVPGLGKTYLAKTLAEVLELKLSRIQFTPDLMPADIIGTRVLLHDEEGTQKIEFQRGPLFSQLVLADEINRASPKTQSALLEVMQEQTVTVSGTQYIMESPYLVIATQNPIEMEGTYPLPEAQLDRFFFKIKTEFPEREELKRILLQNTVQPKPEFSKVMSAEDIRKAQTLIRDLPVTEAVTDYAARLVLATHPQHMPLEKQFKAAVRYGASPRAGIALMLAAKTFALMDGRISVDFADIRRAALPALRHRIILSFQGEAEGLAPEEIITQILKTLPES
jgi:MoxR-like ATPase